VLELAIKHDASACGVATISAGVAGLNEIGRDSEAEALLRAADQALYCAKRTGRNTVVRASRVGGLSLAGWAAA
jgi:PleD family two-component response regulator